MAIISTYLSFLSIRQRLSRKLTNIKTQQRFNK